MRVIGLTGGIACGKSTVAGILRELGTVVIDADEVARKVVEPGRTAWREIVREFGEGVLNPDRSINRRALGEIVFADRRLLARLNSITHPRVIRWIERELRRLRALGEPLVVLDVPLLIEAGMTGMADEVWVVSADRDSQLRRLMERDGFGLEEARKRLDSQMPVAEKRKYADHVIDNSGTIENTRLQVETLWRSALRKARGKLE